MNIDAVPLLRGDRTPHVMGSRLCLAAVNTVWWRRSRAPEEHLREYRDLTELVSDAGWLTDREALEDRANRRPRVAAQAVARGQELREHLLAVFSATAAQETPPATSLQFVEAEAALGFGSLQLIPGSDGTYALGWPEPAIETPVQQLAVSAVLLLASAELDRVKQCPGPTCGWVFLDSTRNRSRRWCNSAECGNRSRVAAHYRRSRASS